MTERRHADSQPQCEICGKQTATTTELEDHIVEAHPEAATPDVRDSYNQRRRATRADRAA